MNIQIILPLISIPILLYIYWRIRLIKLAEYTSPLVGKIEVFEKYNKEKVLTINSYPEGVSIEDKSISKSYFYKAAKLVLEHCQNVKKPKVLMLGLGANTISSLIAREKPSISQTIVEYDAQIIQACIDFFNLKSLPNYKLIQADAFKLFDSNPLRHSDPDLSGKESLTNVSNNSNELRDLSVEDSFKMTKFDAIIVDIFVGTPTLVPHQSNEPDFIEKLTKYLKNDGMIIFNRPGNTETALDGTNKLADYLKTKFKEVKVIYIQDPRRYKNHLIVGNHQLS